jgi:hypothetical protein
MDLWGSCLMQNDFQNTLCEIRPRGIAHFGGQDRFRARREQLQRFQQLLTCKLVPESGLDCLICAEFSRQRPLKDAPFRHESCLAEVVFDQLPSLRA